MQLIVGWIAVLKDWQELIAGILTIAAAFIGGSYVVHSTNRQISLLTRQFRQTVRPYVAVRLRTYAGVIFVLEVENAGQSPAHGLRLHVDKDFYRFVERQNLREMPAFKQEIPYFAPREKLSFQLVQGFNLDKEVDGVIRTPHDFIVRATYRFEGEHYDESVKIDMSHYMESNATRSENEWLEEIAKQLKLIADKAK